LLLLLYCSTKGTHTDLTKYRVHPFKPRVRGGRRVRRGPHAYFTRYRPSPIRTRPIIHLTRYKSSPAKRRGPIIHLTGYKSSSAGRRGGKKRYNSLLGSKGRRKITSTRGKRYNSLLGSKGRRKITSTKPKSNNVSLLRRRRRNRGNRGVGVGNSFPWLKNWPFIRLPNTKPINKVDSYTISQQSRIKNDNAATQSFFRNRFGSLKRNLPLAYNVLEGYEYNNGGIGYSFNENKRKK